MRKLLLILFFTAAVLSACNSPQEAKDTQLELGLNFEKTTYKIGEKITAKVVLLNNSKTDIVVNSRMALNLPGRTPTNGEIAFLVTLPTNKSYIPDVTIDPRFLRIDDFVVLKPGDVLEKLYNLGSFSYKFEDIGIYKISVNYQNLTNTSDISPEDTRSAWIGELTSNVVKITIIP